MHHSTEIQQDSVVLTGHQLNNADTTVAYHRSSNDAVDELLVGRCWAELSSSSPSS